MRFSATYYQIVLVICRAYVMLSIKELRENKRTTTRYQILVAGLLWT